MRHPRLRYYGIDVSAPAIQRARQKFPQARFFQTEPETIIRDSVEKIGLTQLPDIIYAKDVVHHQTRPLEFVTDLIASASRMVIMRCRTKDHGPTEWDPEQSCQYHYDGLLTY